MTLHDLSSWMRLVFKLKMITGQSEGSLAQQEVGEQEGKC